MVRNTMALNQLIRRLRKERVIEKYNSKGVDIEEDGLY